MLVNEGSCEVGDGVVGGRLLGELGKVEEGIGGVRIRVIARVDGCPLETCPYTADPDALRWLPAGSIAAAMRPQSRPERAKEKTAPPDLMVDDRATAAVRKGLGRWGAREGGKKLAQTASTYVSHSVRGRLVKPTPSREAIVRRRPTSASKGTVTSAQCCTRLEDKLSAPIIAN